MNILALRQALRAFDVCAAAGQWIVVAGGAIVSVSAFALGVMISLGKPLARQTGFAVVAVAFLTAALFGLLAYVVPESTWIFSAWTIVLLAYAAVATHRLVRWPTGDLLDQPKSSLALFISYRRQDSREPSAVFTTTCGRFSRRSTFSWTSTVRRRARTIGW